MVSIKERLKGASIFLGVLAFVSAGAVQAQSTSNGVFSSGAGERYVPSIWIDPDGCEHWVMAPKDICPLIVTETGRQCADVATYVA